MKSVDRYNQRISDALFYKGFGHFFKPYKLEEAERGLIEATAAFRSRLIDLMTFDAANNIEADYRTLPVLDREATIAAGQAHYKRQMAEIRARFERPQRPTAPSCNPLGAIFSPMPSPTHEPEFPR